jgi:DNA-binding GntR family transcriptional regulator
MKAVEKAYSTIRAGILDGSFPPSSRITEQEIAAQSGVSRTPVREALRRLQAEGLLQFVPNQGAVVASWSARDIEEIFELRAMLESYVAALAAEHATGEQIDQLRALAERQHALSQQCSDVALDAVSALNSQFHEILQQAAGSKRLDAILSQLIEVPLVSQTFNSYSPEQLVRSARHHLEIVIALDERDSASAAAVMRAHVFAARQAFRALGGREVVAAVDDPVALLNGSA